MNSKNISRSRIVVALLAIGLLFLTVVALPAGVSRGLGDAGREPARPAQDEAHVAYVGRVELEWAMPGEFSDPLPTPTPDPDPQAPPPPDLGEIDLGLVLTLSEGQASGYVDLAFTLVFTREHKVGTTAYGPLVEGTFDGTDLTLTSERVSALIAGQRLMRQFRLTGAAVPDEEGRLSGEYRETVWGYGPQPLTIMGTFTLNEAIPDLATWVVYLPLVMR